MASIYDLKPRFHLAAALWSVFYVFYFRVKGI
jgi:hypothetical protein